MRMLKRIACCAAIAAIVFELMFFLHWWVDANNFRHTDGSIVISIWAAVLTVVFVVFSLLGLLNIDNRIKELSEIKGRLVEMEAEMKQTLVSVKSSAEQERNKIVKMAEKEVIQIMDKSALRQNVFDQMTQITNIPDPVVRIKRWTEILRTKSKDDGVNIGYVYIQRGEALQQLFRDDEALADFEQAKSISPDNPDVYLALGTFYAQRKGDYPKSIEYFQEAVKINAQLAVGYSNIANSYAKMRNYQKAEEYYKKAEDYSLEMPELYYNQAIEISQRGDEDADFRIQEKYYRKCLRLNPFFFKASINLAMIYRERKQDDKAHALLSSLITRSHNSDFINLFIQRGICAMNMNRPAEAINDFMFAYTLDPSNLQTIVNLARCHIQLVHLLEAQQYVTVGLNMAEEQHNDEFKNELVNLKNLIDTVKESHRMVMAQQRKVVPEKQ